MRKILSLLVGIVVSATIYATPLQIPSLADLAMEYDIINNIVLCCYFDVTPCNDVIFVGSYNNWNENPTACTHFTPLDDFEGWYVAEIPYIDGSVGKPLQLKNGGVFGWDYQAGDPAAWIHLGCEEATIVNGYPGEADVSYSKAGAYIYEIAYWTEHRDPCEDIKHLHKYTIKLYSPTICGDFKPAISGNFNGWTIQEMNASIDNESGTIVYTYIIEDEEGKAFKFRQSDDDSWQKQLECYDTNDNRWTIGENLILPVTTTDTTLIFDYSNDNLYRWAVCNEDFRMSISIDKLWYIINIYTGTAEVEDDVFPFDSVPIVVPDVIQYENQDYIVTSIRKNAFAGNQKLSGIFLPASIRNIGDSAFYWCTNLKNVTITAETPPTIGHEVFLFNNDSLSIYIPCGTLESYQSSWYDYASKIHYYPTSYTIYLDETQEQGHIEVEHQTLCDSVPILTAIPNYGYHFVCWSDGNTDNPRSFVLTQDTTFVAEFAKNPVIKYVYDATKGIIRGDTTLAHDSIGDLTFEAVPNYGYHFVQWSDGNTDNPRTIELTQDTAFSVVFEINKYAISVTCNNVLGRIIGDNSNGEFDYLTGLAYEAIPNYGYHFVKWSDGNTDNPRAITLTQDTVLTVVFEPNKYAIMATCDEGQGHFAGLGFFDYLSENEIVAIPNYGYYFVRWSDGNTENPRTIVLIQDTTFAAEFAVDKSGVCGDANLLHWKYADDGTLTISGEGTLNSNYTFGAEAPNGMKSLIVKEGVTTIGNSAFSGKPLASIDLPQSLISIGEYAFANNNVLKKIIIPNNVTTIGKGAFLNGNRLQDIVFGEGIETIGDSAFYNCPYILTIHAQMEYPPVISSSVFASCGDLSGIDCYVQQSSLPLYKKTAVWKEFNLIVGEKLFSITALPSNTQLGSVTGTGAYAAGVEVTLTATPKSGYHFTCWNDGNKDDPRTIVVTYDATFTALFAADAPTGDEVVSVSTTEEGATITTGKVDDNDVNSYSLAICQNGDTICVLTMDAEGRLTGIDFRSMPQRHLPQQTNVEAGGLNIPVTGLAPGTTYHYTLDALDRNKNILDRREGEFTTDGEAPEGFENVNVDVNAKKVIRDGQLFIIRDGKTYNALGAEVK